MLIYVHIPELWVQVLELSRPHLKTTPFVVSRDYLSKSRGHASVLMSNSEAQSFGIRAGMSLSNARQLCPDVVITMPPEPNPEDIALTPWDDVLALLLTFTPMVEDLGQGDALCDVTGCERLFGEPVFIARTIVERISTITNLVAFAGVATNRLVAELSAKYGRGDNSVNRARSVHFVSPGEERGFLAPFPIAVLPEVDEKMLLSFKVMGLKGVGQLTAFSERSLERRFGNLGHRLFRYAMGIDQRPLVPVRSSPAVAATRSPNEGFDDNDRHPNDHIALHQTIKILSDEVAGQLQQQDIGGRLVSLLVWRHNHGALGESQRPSPQPLMKDTPISPESDTLLLAAGSNRIHSMLPTPSRSARLTTESKPSRKTVQPTQPRLRRLESQRTILTMARLVTRHSIRTPKGLTIVAFQLLDRILKDWPIGQFFESPVPEWELEVSQFSAPQQLTLPGIHTPSASGRMERILRQEEAFVSRFGSSPFKHLGRVNLDETLEERRFQWEVGSGLAQ
jgi:DNA polymerase-4